MKRRDVLKGLGLGVAVATISSQKQSLEAFMQGTSFEKSPWWLIAPLQQNSSVGKGWKVSGLSEIKHGASILSLKHSSDDVTNIHICAKEGKERGIACSALLDLVLMDGRQGEQPTREDLGRVVLGIAKRIQQNEMNMNADLASLTRLQSHDERVFRYGPENLL